LIFSRLRPTFTFVIDLDFQLSSGERRYNGRIFLQSSNFSGEEPITTPLRNTTTTTVSQQNQREAHSSTRITTPPNNSVIDNHQIQFDLENLPNDWPTLSLRRRLPPIAIIEEELEEEIEEEQQYPIWEGPEPSTPSWYNEDYRESHDPN